MIVFRIGAEDTPLLARELGHGPQPSPTPRTIQAWVKRSDALLVQIPPPEPPTGSLEQVLTRTRSRYARPRT